MLGQRQSGSRSGLKLLSILRDEELIAQAREDADRIIAEDPDLAAHPELARQVLAFEEDEQSAYLEKA